MDYILRERGYTIVTKNKCMWSKKAKSLLRKSKIQFVEIRVDQNGLSKETWGYKKTKSCFKTDTFPIIYDTNGKKIGGYSELVNVLKI